MKILVGITILVLIISLRVWFVKRRDRVRDEMSQKLFYIETYGPDWDLKYYRNKKEGLI